MTSAIIDIVHKCLYTCLHVVFLDFEGPQSATFQAIGFIVAVGQLTSTPYSRLTFKFDVWSKQTWSYYFNVWMMIFKIWPRDSSQTLPNWIQHTNECIPPHVRIIHLTFLYYINKFPLNWCWTIGRKKLLYSCSYLRQNTH